MSLEKILLYCLLGSLWVSTGFARSVTFMTYNVENLFDTQHDQDKEDYTYLPLKVKKSMPEAMEYCRRQTNRYWRKECFTLDWNEETLKAKLLQLGRVIRTVNDGKGPDILVLQEVENKRVLNQLREVALADLGYQEVVLIEGADKRGIDVGILSKFPLAEAAKLHHIQLEDTSRRKIYTRGILEATFKVGNQNLTVLGNHWPSQSKPHSARVVCAKTLQSIAKGLRNRAVIATGDFNTVETDKPNGLKLYLLSSKQDVDFIDLHQAFDEQQTYSEKIDTDLIEVGSHWYRGKWNSLDRIFLARKRTRGAFGGTCQSLSNCMRPIKASFKVVKEDFMLRDIRYRKRGKTQVYRDIPYRFNKKTGKGFSDHLPVYVKLYF